MNLIRFSARVYSEDPSLQRRITRSLAKNPRLATRLAEMPDSLQARVEPSGGSPEWIARLFPIAQIQVIPASPQEEAATQELLATHLVDKGRKTGWLSHLVPKTVVFWKPFLLEIIEDLEWRRRHLLETMLKARQ